MKVLRERASRFFVTLLWLHVPVVGAIAYANHAGWLGVSLR